MTPELTSEASRVIREARFVFQDEHGLQAGIAAALEAAGVGFTREVILNPKDRIDFLLGGGLGIEVKVKGKPDRVLAQLERYAASERITSLLLVTTVARHRFPAYVNEKPVSVLNIARYRL